MGRFEERTRSSHPVFRRAEVEALINLQRDGDKAKVYQVRQIRGVPVEYGLTGGAPPEPAYGWEISMSDAYRYQLIVYWSTEDGTFVVDMPELPGCMGTPRRRARQ